jgi:Spy/CpxP family protein refolding chaperone
MAIHANDANEAAVRAASAKVASVEADWAVERMKLYGKIAPILTDQQRRKIAGFERRADNFAGGAIARLGERSDN